MTAPSFPFKPTVQSSTSIYLPHATLALDGLAPYHGYTFQEKQVALANGILRPHDVYSGEALHHALEEKDQEREREEHKRRVSSRGMRMPPPPADHTRASSGGKGCSAGELVRPLCLRDKTEWAKEEREEKKESGYSFLSIPTESSRGQSDESERAAEREREHYPRTSVLDGELICVRPPHHLPPAPQTSSAGRPPVDDLKPIWKHHNTRVPPSTALLGTVGSFRPSLTQREAALAFHRRQRRQVYPSHLPSLHSREEIEDYIDTLRGDKVEVNAEIERAIEMLQSPEEFTAQFRKQREQESATGEGQFSSGKASPSPPAIVLEVEKPLFTKLTSSSSRTSSGHRRRGKEKERRSRMGSGNVRGNTSEHHNSSKKTKKKESVNGGRVPTKCKGETTCSGREDAAEGEEDDNQNAIKALFGFMKRGELHKLEEEEEEEEEEMEEDTEEEEEEEGIRYVHCPPPGITTAMGCQCPLMMARHSNNSTSTSATLCKPTHFSPSARNMFDIPRPVFDQVPHGSALLGLTSSGAVATALSDEAMKHLRWIIYEEEYERTLLVTEEQEENPIPYYGSFVAEPGRPALLERLRHPLELTDSHELHRGVDAALDKAIHDILGECERPPTPPPPPPAMNEPTLLDLTYQEAREEKEEIFDCFAAIHDNLRERLALFQEEKTARLNVLSHFVSCQYPKPCRCLLWDMEILEESNVELEPAVPPTCVFVSAVLSYSQVIQEDLLAQRQRELDNMKAQLECFYFSSFSWEHFLQDEQRQWNKLMLYHQYCMQLASKRHAAAALWCEERGLETLRQSDSDSEDEDNGMEDGVMKTNESANSPGNGEGKSERESVDSSEVSDAVVEVVRSKDEDHDGTRRNEERSLDDTKMSCQPHCTAQKSGVPVCDRTSSTKPPGEPGQEKVSAKGPSKPALDLKAMRRCRLHCLGPNDSPFCSYLKFLEVIITTVLEQDGRRTIMMNESQEVASLLGKMCSAFAQTSIATQEREARECVEVEEIFEREAIARECIEWQAIVPGVRLLETERFARQDRIAVEVAQLQVDAVEGAKRISQEYQREYMVLWRSVHTELLDLRRRCMTKEQERALVNEWMSEEPRQYLENEQSRHRMKIMNEEKSHRWLLSSSFLWLKDTYIPNRDRLELQEEKFERQKIILFMEENAARITLEAHNSVERVSLFQHVLVGEDDVKRQRLQRLKARRRVLPPEFNFRRQVVSDLNEFAPIEEIADIFENDFAVI